AARPAAEAVEDAAPRIDGERRRPLGVERAQALVVFSGALEVDDLAHQLDDVDPRADLVEKRRAEPGHQPFARSARVAGGADVAPRVTPAPGRPRGPRSRARRGRPADARRPGDERSAALRRRAAMLPSPCRG